MTIDQLTLSIYKMFFYQGTQSITETGDIKITPGAGKQVLDPKNINWLEIPGPGSEAWKGLEIFKKDMDEASGITDPLLGIITGKTAFEIAQAKESALKALGIDSTHAHLGIAAIRRQAPSWLPGGLSVPDAVMTYLADNHHLKEAS